MPLYVVTDKSTGGTVFEYQHFEPIDHGLFPFADFEHTVQPAAEPEPALIPAKFGGRRLLTKLEFRSLFPEDSIKAIDRFEAQFEQATFLSDAQKDSIRTAFNDYHEATDVDLDDSRWPPGLGLYVSLGIMSGDDVSKVLYG